MDTMIRRLRNEATQSLRPGIYDQCGHKGENHKGGNHRTKALSLSNDGHSYPETFLLAKQYADEHDDIVGLTFSTSRGPKSRFGPGGEIYFHMNLTAERIQICRNWLYIK
jgi:hypothetical protein